MADANQEPSQEKENTSKKKSSFGLIFFLLVLLSATLVAGIIYNYYKLLESYKVPSVKESYVDIPVCTFIYDGIEYNQMLPFMNELDIFTIDYTKAFFTEKEVLGMKVNNQEVLSMQVHIQEKSSGNIVHDGYIESALLKKDEFPVFQLELPELEKDREYVLNLEIEYDEKIMNYYQCFEINDHGMDAMLTKVADAHERMFNGDESYKDYISGENQGGSFANLDQNAEEKLILWGDEKKVKAKDIIYNIFSDREDQYRIDGEFNLARVGEEVTYWDFKETYYYRDVNNEGIIYEFTRVGEKDHDPTYHVENKEWTFTEQDLEEIEIFYSDNKNYLSFELDGELWFQDIRHNILTQIYKQDKIDDDYFFDENTLYKLIPIHISDKGTVKYMKVGYQGKGKMIGFNGIEICEYHYFNETNRSITFIPVNVWYENLATYMADKMKVNEDLNKGYFLYNQEIYSLDFTTGRVEAKGINEAEYISQKGFYIYKNADLTELKMGSLYDYNEPVSLKFPNENFRIIDYFDTGMILGKYSEKYMYKSINQTNFYPYEELFVIDYTGKVEDTFTVSGGSYYGYVALNPEEQGIDVSTYKREEDGSGGIFYRLINDLFINYPFQKTDVAVKSEIIKIEEYQLIIKGEQESDLEQSYTRSTIDDSDREIYDTINDHKNIYEIYEMHHLVDRVNSLDEYLINNDWSKSPQIFYIKEDGTREVWMANDYLEAYTIAEDQQEEFSQTKEADRMTVENLDLQKIKAFIANDKAIDLQYSEREAIFPRDIRVIKESIGYREVSDYITSVTIIGYDENNIIVRDGNNKVQTIEGEVLEDRMRITGNAGQVKR